MDSPELIRKLKTKSVGIAGAGGLGSNVAMALARAGVGRLVIVDYDIVEEKNLNRQHYTLDQVGKPKLDCLKLNIEKAVRDIQVDIINLKLEPGSMEEPFADVDVVVEALDAAETKARFIEEILLKLPDKCVVAASGVAGIGGSQRVRELCAGKLCLVQDPKAKSSDDDVLLAPKVGLMAYWQANVVLEILAGE